MPPRGGQHRHVIANRRVVLVVSSHAPARGATARHDPGRRNQEKFQVMPPRGGQPPQDRRRPAGPESFKSCPREGGNRQRTTKGACRYGFKSCPREGGNMFAFSSPDYDYMWFQVMPPRGGQPIRVTGAVNCLGVSSHAPARGATALLEGLLQGIVFQVMPPRGGQPCRAGHPDRGRAGVSSHAPARGATCGAARDARGDPGFKSCPREGGNATHQLRL